MKVIDEKGRLFGKINLIDFSIILILICSLPVFYATTKMIDKTSKLAPQEENLFFRFFSWQKWQPLLLYPHLDNSKMVHSPSRYLIASLVCLSYVFRLNTRGNQHDVLAGNGMPHQRFFGTC